MNTRSPNGLEQILVNVKLFIPWINSVHHIRGVVKKREDVRIFQFEEEDGGWGGLLQGFQH